MTSGTSLTGCFYYRDGEWLDRWQRFHAPSKGAAPPSEDEDGPLPAGAFLTNDEMRTMVADFHAEHTKTAEPGSDHYTTTALNFMQEKPWVRATNQPIDMVAVDEAIARAPSAGMVLEFGVFQATTIRDLSLYMEQRHDEIEADDGAPPPPFLKADIHGFDSFEGLPHDWEGRSGMKAGHFSLNGQIPPVFIESVCSESAYPVNDADGITHERNVILHKGWFDKTVPPFLADLPSTADGSPVRPRKIQTFP